METTLNTIFFASVTNYVAKVNRLVKWSAIKKITVEWKL